MTTSLINVAAIGLALLILWRTEPAIARMSKATHWMIRYALLLLAGGAVCVILTIPAGAQIDPLTLIILAGIALLLSCDRRLRALVRHRHPGDRHA